MRERSAQEGQRDRGREDEVGEVGERERVAEHMLRRVGVMPLCKGRHKHKVDEG